MISFDGDFLLNVSIDVFRSGDRMERVVEGDIQSIARN